MIDCVGLNWTGTVTGVARSGINLTGGLHNSNDSTLPVLRLHEQLTFFAYLVNAEGAYLPPDIYRFLLSRRALDDRDVIDLAPNETLEALIVSKPFALPENASAIRVHYDSDRDAEEITEPWCRLDVFQDLEIPR